LPNFGAEKDPGSYRPLVLEDAALLAQIQAASFADMKTWSEKAMAEVLGMRGALGFLVCLDQRPAGYLMARFVAPEAEIVSLAVKPEARRRGLARSLMRLLICQVAARGGDRIFLEVAETNKAARSLYDSLDFIPVGRRPGYYGSNAGEALGATVMAYSIAPSNC
jgi:ribosomal-protein-alanine N-acetyltransferase